MHEKSSRFDNINVGPLPAVGRSAPPTRKRPSPPDLDQVNLKGEVRGGNRPYLGGGLDWTAPCVCANPGKARASNSRYTWVPCGATPWLDLPPKPPPPVKWCKSKESKDASNKSPSLKTKDYVKKPCWSPPFFKGVYFQKGIYISISETIHLI